MIDISKYTKAQLQEAKRSLEKQIPLHMKRSAVRNRLEKQLKQVNNALNK